VNLCPLKHYGIWPNWKISISSEIVLGTTAVIVCMREGVSAGLRQRLRIARATVSSTGGAPRLFLIVCQLLMLFFLFWHKLAGRFLGQGLNVPGRNPLECQLPILIFSHEPFNTWGEASTVWLAYFSLWLCARHALATAVGMALVAKTWSGRLPLCVFLALEVAVSIFETHHAVDSGKMEAKAGSTGCTYTFLVWFALLPAAAICWLDQSWRSRLYSSETGSQASSRIPLVGPADR